MMETGPVSGTMVGSTLDAATAVTEAFPKFKVPSGTRHAQPFLLQARRSSSGGGTYCVPRPQLRAFIMVFSIFFTPIFIGRMSWYLESFWRP